MKATAKTKTAAIDVPQSDEAANALLAQYGETYNAIAKLQADLDDALAKVKGLFETQSAPLQEKLKIAFLQLTSWGAAHRDRLTENGKSKTVLLPAGQIGWRHRPPSVRWVKGMKAEDIVVAIKNAGLRRFLRIKEEPNKERMLEEPDVAATVKGVVIGSAGEDFFVAAVGMALAEPKGRP
ncbi:MAG: host-nuclease inhibitor Gam family protein [Rhizomicrobium sp.]